MRITDGKKTVIFCIIFFLILPCVFMFIAGCLAMTFEQGLAGGGPYLSDILFNLANWPNLFLKIYRTIITMHGTEVYSVERGIFNPLVIIVNTIGWGMVGFIIGLIISAVKGRKRRRGKQTE